MHSRISWEEFGTYSTQFEGREEMHLEPALMEGNSHASHFEKSEEFRTEQFLLDSETATQEE